MEKHIPAYFTTNILNNACEFPSYIKEAFVQGPTFSLFSSPQ